MKTLSFLIFMCFLFHVQPKETDSNAYCESCLTAADEIEKALKEAPAESRLTILKDLLHGGVCKKLHSFQHAHVSKDELVSSCIQLMDSNYDQFYEAVATKDANNLKIILCYEQSKACVGVKRKSFEDSKKPFSDSHIEALLQANKEQVRIVRPVHTESQVNSRDEL